MGEQQSVVRVVRSRVKIRKLSQSDLAAYLATGESMDKAGAYAAQGHGAALIEGIQGSYTNVVGLPMAQLAWDLEAAFGVPLFGWRGTGTRGKGSR
jgi:septum formation protein